MREKFYTNIPHAKAKGLFHWNNALLFKPIPCIKKSDLSVEVIYMLTHNCTARLCGILSSQRLLGQSLTGTGPFTHMFTLRRAGSIHLSLSENTSLLSKFASVLSRAPAKRWPQARSPVSIMVLRHGGNGCWERTPLLIRANFHLSEHP